jgi:hypothetical protein
VQYDCGKLQELAELLRRLKAGGHRVLIFTQMTKMLDHLESFINLYGYTYMRLDGSIRPEQRQILMQRFNTDPKIFLFILSTRSGGVGVNLVGANTVIFYDSDWNPAMDLQAQDRTIEENILKKANQDCALDDLVIHSGGYNADFFKKLDPMELFGGAVPARKASISGAPPGGIPAGGTLAEPAEVLPERAEKPTNTEVQAALGRAEDEEDYAALKWAEQEEALEAAEFNEKGGPAGEEDEEGGAPKAGEGQPAKGGEVVALEEEGDVLKVMKQRAAAAGKEGNCSFEDQLQPIKRWGKEPLEAKAAFLRCPNRIPSAHFLFESCGRVLSVPCNADFCAPGVPNLGSVNSLGMSSRKNRSNQKRVKTAMLYQCASFRCSLLKVPLFRTF